jgi:LAO/AO transport system kinase
MKLADSVLAGDRLALARLLSYVENDTAEGRAALDSLFPHTGRSHLVGVTGAPGTGKSSLVNRLAYVFRHPPGGASPRRVAVVAVDPSSPFTGGAILGDRIRMRDLAGDPGVFIRSMAARGSLGGLAGATAGLVQVFDAAGYDLVFIETVGVGQGEVDIARLAHTTLVVEAPNLGDEIQAIKAGILEIADILVVNKADLPGVENTERALRSMLDLSQPSPRSMVHHKASLSPPASLIGQPGWVPPIQRTISTEAVGIEELAALIDRHRDYLGESGNWQRRERLRLESELEMLLREALVSRWRISISESQYQAVLGRLVERRISPRQAVECLVDGRVLRDT